MTATAIQDKPAAYRLGYALAMLAGPGGLLTGGCIRKCCGQPALWATIARHAADAIRSHPTAGAVVAAIAPGDLPALAGPDDQGAYWLGYYAGLSL